MRRAAEGVRFATVMWRWGARLSAEREKHRQPGVAEPDKEIVRGAWKGGNSLPNSATVNKTQLRDRALRSDI